MSDLTNVFTNIADAIRAKTNAVNTYKPTEMAGAINNISGGGGAFEITTGRVLTSFNMPVTIPNSVTNVAYCFNGFSNFNQPVIIPNSVTNMTGCFVNCYNFNQSVIIPNSVTSMLACFGNCHNFNQPIIIPNSVTIMRVCFQNCSSFNQPITIPNSVTDMGTCFQNCSSFNQPITIPNSVTGMSFCFSLCSSLTHVLVKTNPSLNVRNMVFRKNEDLQLIIETNNTSKFIGNADVNSIIGTAITWTSYGTGNYYNSVYNINIINNQSLAN